MRYLTLRETLALYHRVIDQSGGSRGIRDLGAVESALAQPQMTFGGADLYPTIAAKDLILWIGGEFDPEAFDLKSVNAALRRIRHWRDR